ncbi:MAG: hypothetical protein GF384_00350, partial [Elusimicrobia bacterium]|nr:hypothetical protein [Elusimicrobiota bacterium]MBD3411546.1 hypothetical protein [Elusimicrobiota bacterium]
EPVTLHITIAGTGNIKSITEPLLGELANFRRYETVSSLNTQVKDYRVTGSKEFQIVLVPETSGDHVIPQASFTYFDPRAKTYTTIASDPIPVTVQPGTGEVVQTIAEPQTTGVKVIGDDIRFIKIAGMQSIPSGPPYCMRSFFWILILSATVTVLAIWVYDVYRTRLRTDLGWARSRSAYSNGLIKIKTAGKSLKHGDQAAFYAYLSDALIHFIADKLNIAAAGLTIRDVVGYARARGVDDDIIETMKDILEHCDLARFTATTTTEQEKKLLMDKTKQILTKLAGAFK